MKKIILSVFILTSFFAFPLFSHASYIIHLKGGGQYITAKYWEENGQIIFFVSGGTMGIDKDTVRKIEKSKAEPEDVYETDSVRKIKELDRVYIEGTVIQNVAKKPQPQPLGQKAEKTDNDLVDIEYYKREKQRLEQELDEAKQRYLSSLEKGDKETKHAASGDALKINVQIDQLKKELKEKNKGVLPEWWNE